MLYFINVKKTKCIFNNIIKIIKKKKKIGYIIYYNFCYFFFLSFYNNGYS